MMSSNLVLSSLSWSDGGGIDWFATHDRQGDGPVLIEWNAKRSGAPGNLSDHPSIDAVDQWAQKGGAAGIQPYAIHLPLYLSHDADQAGAEISAAGGWTDLASYINAPLIRLDFTQDCEFHSQEAQQALRSILHYMADMERLASVHFTPSLLGVWPQIVDGLDAETLGHFGEHIIAEGDSASSKKSGLPLLSVEVSIAEMDETSAALLQQYKEKPPENAPYIIASIGA
ncbi:MAG: hypothetical protein P9L94_14995 [Candidatus Hinthialibacter antarcticus]|nr:hypothetical protein [Candidatus Hinthialibacter antarcticus]